MKHSCAMIFVVTIFGFASAVDVSAQNVGGKPTKPAPVAVGRVCNAEKDFSGTQNPHQEWSYGSFESDSFAEFKLLSPSKRRTGNAKSSLRSNTTWKKIEGWFGMASAGDGNPSVIHCFDTGTSRVGTVTVPSNCLIMHPGPGGERSVVRYKATRRALFKVEGYFNALDATTTDPHILVNGEEVVKIEPINGKGQKREFSFSQVVDLSGTIDFVVGHGGNGFTCDATGFNVTITPLAPPALIKPTGAR